MEINNWKEKLDDFIVSHEIPDGAVIYINPEDFQLLRDELKQWKIESKNISKEESLVYANRLLVPNEDILRGEFEFVESLRTIEFGSVSQPKQFNFGYKTLTE